MKKILVTGGSGYIGSHTVLELLEAGFEVVNIDNNSRSTKMAIPKIEALTGKKIADYTIDICDSKALEEVIKNEGNINGIIHFAAYKEVGESVAEPLMYYENNLYSLINLLKFAKQYHIENFVFSSSCTVYGIPDTMPVDESFSSKPPASPYGATKQMGEQIIRDFAIANPSMRFMLLRYFNPVGAHPSNEIGEVPARKPANLIPSVTQSAIGKIPSLTVHGDDYDTLDGSCLRDYIHVSDLAIAHIQSLDYLSKMKEGNLDVINVGLGQGFTVLQVLNRFEEVNNLKLDYTIGPRRPGDVPAIFSDNTKAKEKLGFNPKYDLDDMLRTAWLWEKKMAES